MSSVVFHPIIGSIQKIALYETRQNFYLVGSNNTLTRYRVLKIDRTEPRELVLYDDKVEYTQDEIHDLINMIEGGNRLRTGLNIISAFGIVGIYSYDLTHTLQHNLSPPKQIIPNLIDELECTYKQRDELLNTSMFIDLNGSRERQNFGVRMKPHRKFVWNFHLLSKIEKELHPDWILYITHGFVGQSNMSVFGRSIYVTLIARRSCKYAGTRFLKRGANFQGDVANEVETEQMVHDSGVSSLNDCHITSFVQMRGSIPGHWRQEMGKMVAKPAITIDLYDPFVETAGAHFNELLKRYGSPIIILNLVKQREKKKQESLLSDELNSAVKYLNQFLPPDYQMQYKTFDMARKNKSNANVMQHLAIIAKNAVMKTGIFHNKPQYFAQKSNTVAGQNKFPGSECTVQTGIIRTNCVDCLDRTNTAQFAIGKCVLGFQLCALGILDSPKLEFDTDCVRMLESMYEDHGDTLALQYGGSQLVHRIKTYRKTAPWTSQGNDIMQTLSRYYSNTFSDAEKQNTINLFLGIFVPDETKPQIWDYSSDYYFHHKPNPIDNSKPLTQWWSTEVLNSLPYSYNDLVKPCSEIIQVHSAYIEMIDAYTDYHRPYELTVLNDMFAYKICFFFRMWLITESQNSFNLVLAQNSLKIAYEAPQGIRNNLLRTYATWGPDYFASLKPTAARIFFILACVNALLQERRNYIPQGWSKWYDFSDVDLIAAVKLTTPALAATNAQVPWKLLKGLCADAVYGGRIENIQDFSILESYLNQFFLDDVLSHRWKPFTLNNSIPLSTKYDDYVTAIQQLSHRDLPSYFGLSENIDRSWEKNVSKDIIKDLKLLEGDKIKQLSFNRQTWQRGLTPYINLWKKVNQGQDFVKINLKPNSLQSKQSPILSFIQEEFYNAVYLIQKIHKHFTSLNRLSRANCLPDDKTMVLATSLLNQQVPNVWSKLWNGPSDPNKYLRYIIVKTVKIRNWQTEEINYFFSVPMNLSLLFNPETFLAAFKQHYSREHKIALDELTMQTTWKNTPDSIILEGLLISGALFDGILLSTCTANTESINPVPYCYITWIQKKNAVINDKFINVPLYYTSDRDKQVAQIQIPCDSKEKDNWIKTGLAFFLSY
ncbi:SacI homology domain [Popillia japonica]|uniref:SacI homology domain n=1 Tax=Popillia japonica TaxID=7064 RepID=A0AAW1MLG4_POPJA